MEITQSTLTHEYSDIVKVFLRITTSKKGTDFSCPSTLTESELVDTLINVINSHHFLKREYSQSIDKATFVIQGRRIEAKSSQMISLRPNTIIHMVEEQNKGKQEIKVTFRYQNPQEGIDVSHVVQVKVDNLIEGEVQNIAPLHFSKFVHELTIVYLGAEVSPSKSIKEANIGDNAEIILIDKLRNQKEQMDPFESGQELPLEGFYFMPRTIQVAKKESIEKDGFNMPFNPMIEANKVKQLLEENVRENELFLQQQQQNAILLQNAQNQIKNEAPLLIQTEVKQEKMDSEKEIPTKEEIEAENIGQKMEEEPSNQ